MVLINALGVMSLLASTANPASDVASDSATTTADASEAEPKWKGGPYFTFGFAPMATMDINAKFHPGLRYDIESGLAWKRGRVRGYFGPDFHLMQYYGRKKVGFGVDAMATFTLRHIYARVGAGTAFRVPASPNVNDTRPMIGGLLGAGFVGRLESVEGRLGVDYDARVDTTGRVAQTLLFTLRLTVGP